MHVVRRRLLIACALVTLGASGCGGGGGGGSTLTNGKPRGRKGLLYTGTTDQRQPVRIEATPKMLGTIKLQLDCKDGSSSRVTLTTGPPGPTLYSDGSFYYQESGRTTNRQFPGFGAGRYRGAMDGEIVGKKGTGH